MNVRLGAVLAVSLAFAGMTIGADDLKSGLTDRTAGPFDVKAITGDNAGKQLCYV
jgi:hypothetical protein